MTNIVPIVSIRVGHKVKFGNDFFVVQHVEWNGEYGTIVLANGLRLAPHRTGWLTILR